MDGKDKKESFEKLSSKEASNLASIGTTSRTASLLRTSDEKSVDLLEKGDYTITEEEEEENEKEKVQNC